MKKVKFIKDFATKRIGDVINCDGSLASQLVHSDQVAEFTEEDVTPVISDNEHIPVKSEVEPDLEEIEVVAETEEVAEFTEEAPVKKAKK